MTSTPEKIWPSNTISSLELPYRELLLSEGLGLFPKNFVYQDHASSKTIAEQALEVGLKPSELIRRLSVLLKLVDGVELTEKQFTKHLEVTHLLVVGDRSGWWSVVERPTAYLDEMPLVGIMNWREHRVVCVGHFKNDCVSTALFLRQQGFRKAYVYFGSPLPK